MTILSNNLKYLRTKYNLSQQQFADNIGIKQRTYSDYENGKREPTASTLAKIAEIFMVSIDMLVSKAWDFTSTDEEKARDDELCRKTGLTKTDFIYETIRHTPEIAKASIQKRAVQPKTRKMEKIQKTVHEMKNKTP